MASAAWATLMLRQRVAAPASVAPRYGRRTRLRAILTLLAGALSASGVRAECVRTFQLVTPEDWRCAEEGAARCTVCRNRSLHTTELVVHCAADGTEEHHVMPPGGAVAICGGRPS